MKAIFSILILLYLWIPAINAQVTGIYKNFRVRQAGIQIEVDWVIAAGNTCFNMEVQRSTDSVNFEGIGFFFGACGNEDDDEPYSFIDEGPFEDNTAYFYRIYASNGLILSASREIVYRNPSGPAVILFPNPASDIVNVNFRNPDNTEWQLELFDLNGRSIRSLQGVPGCCQEVDITGLAKGKYILLLSDPDGNKIGAYPLMVN